MEKMYIKQTGNPKEDGLYDTDKGPYVYHQGAWWFKTAGSFHKVYSENLKPEYFYNPVKTLQN